MAFLKFFVPHRAPHPEGEMLAKSFFGAEVASHGDELAENNMHYGILYAENLPAKCFAKGKRWIHVDHGMFHRSSGLNKWDGYYRFSAGSQANLYREPMLHDRKRLEKLLNNGTLRMLPFQVPTKGKIFAYQPPSDHMRRFYGLPEDFDQVALECMSIVLETWPEMDIVVVPKGPKGEDFYENLGGFVSFGSTVAVECLQRGISVWNMAPNSFFPDNKPQWAGDEKERLLALAYIAGRNFTLEEMKNGEAWWHLIQNEEILTQRGTA